MEKLININVKIAERFKSYFYHIPNHIPSVGKEKGRKIHYRNENLLVQLLTI